MDRGTCCDQVQFRGSLLELTELARCARAGLGGEIGSLESLPAFDERAADIRQEWSRPRVGANITRYQNYLLKGLASFSPLIQTRGLGQLTIYIHLSFVTFCDIL